MPLSSVNFSCTLRRDGNALHVTYTIENASKQTIGVFDRLRRVRLDGTNDFSRDLVYVDLEGEALQLRKMALKPPPGLQVGGYTPPNASRIPSGEALTARIEVTSPARVCHPYKRALLSGEVIADVPRRASDVVVSIGVFACDAGAQLVQEHPAYPDVWSASAVGAALAAQVILSEAFTLDPPIEVLDYRGVPWP